jgi:hypothetical protein
MVPAILPLSRRGNRAASESTHLPANSKSRIEGSDFPENLLARALWIFWLIQSGHPRTGHRRMIEGLSLAPRHPSSRPPFPTKAGVWTTGKFVDGVGNSSGGGRAGHSPSSRTLRKAHLTQENGEECGREKLGWPDGRYGHRFKTASQGVRKSSCEPEKDA